MYAIMCVTVSFAIDVIFVQLCSKPFEYKYARQI